LSQKHDYSAVFFETLVGDLPDSVITLSINGIIESANKATERILGISVEEILN
jgi:PAS domain S-box-containing protein